MVLVEVLLKIYFLVFATLIIYVVYEILVRRNKIPYSKLDSNIQAKMIRKSLYSVENIEVCELRKSMKRSYIKSVKEIVIWIAIAGCMYGVKEYLMHGKNLDIVLECMGIILLVCLCAVGILYMRDSIPKDCSYVGLPGYIVKVEYIYVRGADLRYVKVVYYDCYKKRFYMSNLEDEQILCEGDWVYLLMWDRGDSYKPMRLLSKDTEQKIRKEKINTNFALTQIQNREKENK